MTLNPWGRYIPYYGIRAMTLSALCSPDVLHNIKDLCESFPNGPYSPQENDPTIIRSHYTYEIHILEIIIH